MQRYPHLHMLFQIRPKMSLGLFRPCSWFHHNTLLQEWRLPDHPSDAPATIPARRTTVIKTEQSRTHTNGP